MTEAQRKAAYRDWYPAYLLELEEKRSLLHRDRRVVSRRGTESNFDSFDDKGQDLMTTLKEVGSASTAHKD